MPPVPLAKRAPGSGNTGSRSANSRSGNSGAVKRPGLCQVTQRNVALWTLVSALLLFFLGFLLRSHSHFFVTDGNATSHPSFAPASAGTNDPYKNLPPDEDVCVSISGKRCTEEQIRQGPPPGAMDELPISQADEALLGRVREMYSKSNGQPLEPAEGEQLKVAFLFLTRGPMPLARLWERFLRGHEDRYSIYVHATPGLKYDSSSSPLFYEREVPSGPVRWGFPSMVAAERRLLAHALLDPANRRFVIVSESCLPVLSFDLTYRYLMDVNLSLLHSACDPSWNCIGRYSGRMKPAIQKEQWSKGSQWWSLTWHHAYLAATDAEIFPVMATWCRGDDWHRHCYMDEHYFQTLMKIRDPDHVARRGPTWAAWGGGAHPIAYDSAALTPEFLQSLRKPTCDWGGRKQSCFLILRKIDVGALPTLLSYSEEELGY